MISYKEKPIGVGGIIKFDRDYKTGDIAIIIGETWARGKGLGKMALQKLVDYGFQNLKLNRIGADIFEFNKISDEKVYIFNAVQGEINIGSKNRKWGRE